MDQFHKALIELNMDSPEELQSYIQKLSVAVEQAKQKILQAEVNLEVDVVDSKPEVTEGLEWEVLQGHLEREALPKGRESVEKAECHRGCNK